MKKVLVLFLRKSAEPSRQDHYWKSGGRDARLGWHAPIVWTESWPCSMLSTEAMKRQRHKRTVKKTTLTITCTSLFENLYPSRPVPIHRRVLSQKQDHALQSDLRSAFCQVRSCEQLSMSACPWQYRLLCCCVQWWRGGHPHLFQGMCGSVGLLHLWASIEVCGRKCMLSVCIFVKEKFLERSCVYKGLI